MNKIIHLPVLIAQERQTGFNNLQRFAWLCVALHGRALQNKRGRRTSTSRAACRIGMLKKREAAPMTNETETMNALQARATAMAQTMGQKLARHQMAELEAYIERARASVRSLKDTVPTPEIAGAEMEIDLQQSIIAMIAGYMGHVNARLQAQIGVHATRTLLQQLLLDHTEGGIERGH